MAIKSFKHKGLKKFFYNGDASGIQTNHEQKVGFILDAIDSSHYPQDLKALYANKFAEKKGSGEGVYTIEVNGNWRITFQVKDDGAVLVDYHGKQIKAV